MNDEAICPVCGVPLTRGMPEEFCPSCLLGAGLESDLTDSRGEVDIIAEKPGDMVGRYRLVEQIGEGGFGVVFRAEQRVPVRRSVALKVVKPGMDSREVVTRFEAERQALALMDHPHIAKVYDAGTTDMGRPYFVMEYVEGHPLTVFCDEQALDIRARLELFVWVCQAVQHAHQKGVIHRDLKPSNILVRDGEVGSPQPKVIDFGVAKAIGIALTEQTFFTVFGRILGTPLYMSPEQAGLNEVDVDTRSDIYTLGVVLYELMTGRTPLGEKGVSAASFDETRRRIREEEPLRPSARVLSLGDEQRRAAAASRRIDPAKYGRYLGGDLDWIVMKALEKDRSRRYDTAQGLGIDVRRYLDGLPVNAGPPGASYRIRKFVRRHRGPVIAGALVLLAVIGGMVGFWKVNLDKNIEVNTEKRKVEAKDIALDEQKKQVEAKDIALGEEKRKVEEERMLKEAEKNEKEFQHLQSLVTGVKNRRKEEPGSRKKALETLRQVAEYPLDQIGVTGLRARQLRDAARNELVACLAWTDLQERPLPIDALLDSWGPAALDATQQRCALSAENGRLEVWDASGGGRLAFRPDSGPQVKGPLRFSADGTLVAAGFGTAALWDLVLWDWEANKDLEAKVRGVHAAFDFHPAGDGFVVGSPEGGIAMFHRDGSPQRELTAPGGIPLAIRFSPDGRHLAVAMEPSGVVVIDVATGAREAPWEGVAAISLAWSPDGHSCVAGGADGSVTVLERGAPKPVFMAMGEHSDKVDQVAWSADGRLIASACRDEIRLWDGRQGKLLCKYTAWARTLGFSKNDPPHAHPSLGPVLSGTGTLSVLEIPPSRVCHRAAGHLHQKIKAAAWVADGTVLATAADDGLRLWNREGLQLTHHPGVRVRPGGLTSSLPGHPGHLYLATEDGISRRAISTPDGKLRCGNDEMLNERIRDAEQILLSPSAGPVGPFLAVARDTGVVLLDPNTGRELTPRLPAPPSTAYVAISPDGRWLAAGTRGGGQVRIWRLDAPDGAFTDLPVGGGSTVSFYPLTHKPGQEDAPLPPFLMTGDDEAYRLWTADPAAGGWRQVGDDHLSKMTNSWGRMAQMVFSPRGTVVVVTYDRRYLQVLHPVTMEVMTQPGFDEQWPLTISPDGRWMATEAPKGRLFIWDLAEVRTELKTLDWSPDVLPPYQLSTSPVVRP